MRIWTLCKAKGRSVAISQIALAPCRFFASAPPAALQFAAAHMEMRHLRKRELLGDIQLPFTGFGIVLQGAMQAVDMTMDGKEVALLSVQPYETFGHISLLAEQPLALTWVATSASTTVALMPEDRALQLMQFPELVLQLARSTSQQVCDLLSWQKIQAIHPVSARVCAWLLHHGRQQMEMQLPTHAELAWRLNTTGESVTRVLQKLLTDQVLQRDGDTWRITSPETLKDLTRGSER